MDVDLTRQRSAPRFLRWSFSILIVVAVVRGSAQSVDLSVHGFRSDVTVPIGDLTKRSLEYARIPIAQAVDMDFAASVSNQGTDTAFNVLVELIATFDGVDLAAFHSDTIAQLAPGDADTIRIPAGLSVSEVGTVGLQFSVTSETGDTIPANDQDSISVEVGEGTYCRIADDWTDTMDNGEQGSKFFVRYEFLEQDYICVVRCVVPFDPGMVGIPIVGGLYDQGLDLLGSSVEETLWQSTMSEPGEANWINLLLPEPISVEPGHDY